MIDTLPTTNAPSRLVAIAVLVFSCDTTVAEDHLVNADGYAFEDLGAVLRLSDSASITSSDDGWVYVTEPVHNSLAIQRFDPTSRTWQTRHGGLATPSDIPDISGRGVGG